MTKVFIILNLLLAVAVAVLVPTNYAYQEHWKRRWNKDTTELKSDIEALDKQVLAQSFRATQAETARDAFQTELNIVTTRVSEQQSEVKTLKAERAQLSTQLSELNVTLNAQREKIQSLEDSLELERQRRTELNHIAQVARAVAFQLNVKLAEVEDDLNNAQAELTRAERDGFDLEEELKRKNAYLALVRDNHPEVYRQISGDVPSTDEVVRGIVAAVRVNPQGKQDLVMLTVGADEGVREGMEFIIYRNNSYIVKVRAERTMGDMVACRVIADTWNGRGDEIMQGDAAQNRLF
ncbi:MAG: hypothetical protein ACYTF0_07635 [Planctomycetota bacterium]